MTVSPINFGPLESLLADPAITAIYIDIQNVRYTKAGQTLASDIVFESDVQRRQLIERILASCVEVPSADRHTVDCTLTDGTRVQVVYAPLSLSLHKGNRR